MSFNVDNSYAKKYDEWRRKEELQRLKDKYGENVEEDSDDSSSDSESEEDPMLEEDWLKTLKALKTKDPKIYQKDYKFFQDVKEDSSSSGEDDSHSKKKKKKEKPMYLKDYERKVILEKGGIISSDEEEFNQEEDQSDVVTYHQEQEEIRKNVVKAAGDIEEDDSDDGIGGGLLLKRKRTMHEVKEEEKEQKEWTEEQEDLTQKRQSKPFGIDAEPMNTWEIPNLDQREKFLKNFILGQTYSEKDNKRVPTYDEVVYGDEDEDAFRQEKDFLEKAEKFEKRHNFRFEEYGSSEVKSYPREIKNLVRQKDNKRTKKRNVAKERKHQEKEKKSEEIKRMKNLKRQEILTKIEKLKAVTGNDSLGFNPDDLEEDFDPNKHDEMMQKQFDEDYYTVGADEVQKPEFEMSDDEVNWDHWKGGDHDNSNFQEDEPHADDPNFCMDADYDPSVKKESRKKSKRKKNKNKLDEVLEQNKPVFDPNEKTFEEYIDEYYNLDYEDIIDDIPCRFKYRKVTPNSFGLTSDEILNSNEKELNTWVSLKKVSQYRTDEEEQYDIKAFNVKAQNENLKRKVLYSVYERNEDKQKGDADKAEGSESIPSGKRKRKRGKGKNEDQLSFNEKKSETVDNHKERKMLSVEPGTSGEMADVKGEHIEESQVSEPIAKKKKKKKHRNHSETVNDKSVDSVSSEHEVTQVVKSDVTEIDSNKNSGESVSKKKKKHKKKKNQSNEETKKQKKPKVSNARLKAYGINPKKYKSMEQADFKFKH